MTACRNSAASVAPISRTTTQPEPRRHGKSRRRANAMLTAGFRCAPETLPTNRITANTVSPGATTASVRLIMPGKTWPIMPLTAAASTKKERTEPSEIRRRRSWRAP